MLKNFLLKKMMRSQLKGVPEAEQDKLLAIIEKNPALFQKIATRVQEKMKEGKDQATASMEAAQEHQDELKNIIAG